MERTKREDIASSIPWPLWKSTYLSVKIALFFPRSGSVDHVLHESD